MAKYCRDNECPVYLVDICCWSCPKKHECPLLCDWINGCQKPGDCGNMKEI